MSRQPEITIARLYDVAYRVLRQSVVRRPVIETKLGGRCLAANQEEETEKKP
jgi:hypothetical protein